MPSTFVKKAIQTWPGLRYFWNRRIARLNEAKLNDERMNLLRTSTRLQQEMVYNSLMQSPRYADPRCLIRFERQVFSQNGEDGIIAEIFRRIGATNKFFAEVGVGDGLENNTACLLQNGWSGVWVDGDRRHLAFAAQEFKPVIDTGHLTILNRMITKSNIASIFAEGRVPEGLDLLSLDIDRNTFFLWEPLAHLRARVVVVEYNATIPPSDEFCVDDAPNSMWNAGSYYGASLKTYEKLGEKLGYVLVSCELSGNNAFFLRKDLLTDAFPGPFTAEHHYQPPRYYLSRTLGHHRRFSDHADNPPRQMGENF